MPEEKILTFKLLVLKKCIKNKLKKNNSLQIILAGGGNGMR